MFQSEQTRRSCMKVTTKLALALIYLINIVVAGCALTFAATTLRAMQKSYASMLGFPMLGIQQLEILFRNFYLLNGFTITKACHLLIAVSVFMAIVSIFGCAVLIRPSKSAIRANFVLIFVNFVILSCLGYSTLVANRKIQINLSPKLSYIQYTIDVIGDNQLNPPGYFFYKLQKNWGCCGVATPSEWLAEVPFFRHKYLDFSQKIHDPGMFFPGCSWRGASQECIALTHPPGHPTIDCIRVPSYHVYPKGCSHIIGLEVGKNLSYFVGAVFALATVQIFGVIALLKFDKFFGKSKKSHLNYHGNEPDQFPTVRIDLPQADELAALCTSVIKQKGAEKF